MDISIEPHTSFRRPIATRAAHRNSTPLALEEFMCPSRRGCSPNRDVRRISSAERRFYVPLDHPEFITAHNENADSLSMSHAPKQSPISGNVTGTTTFTFHAAGNRQVNRAPSDVAKYVGNYENQMTGVVKPDGRRITMAYNAHFRRTDNWS